MHGKGGRVDPTTIGMILPDPPKNVGDGVKIESPKVVKGQDTTLWKRSVPERGLRGRVKDFSPSLVLSRAG